MSGYAKGVLPRVRIALAVTLLGLFGTLYTLIAMAPETGLRGFFGTLAALNGIAVLGLVAGWFWARWFARGLGMWGLMAGIMLMLMGGIGTVTLIFAGSHLMVVFMLSGAAVGSRYDGRTDWQERYGLDERGASRVADMVTNLGSLLPWVAFYTLFPRQTDVAMALSLVLLTGGLFGILRNRTWGLLAVGVAGVTLIGVGATAASCGPALIGGAMLLVLAPTMPAIVRFLRG